MLLYQKRRGTVPRLKNMGFSVSLRKVDHAAIDRVDCQMCIRDRVFYGHNLAAGPTGDISYDFLGGVSKSWPEAPIILLAINAIDGSIIDLDKGY